MEIRPPDRGYLGEFFFPEKEGIFRKIFREIWVCPNTERRRVGKQRREDHDDGEISDGGVSTASSKMARGLSAMAFGRDSDDIR